MSRSWPLSLPVAEIECTTSFPLNSFISMTLSFSFLTSLLQSLMGNKVCEELHLCAKEKKIKALWKVYFQSEAAKLVVVLCLCRFLAFQQIWWTLLVQTTAWFQLLAWWMSWSVHLNDRKAAYHVPHRQATDICHLQSFSFPLASPSFCLLNRHSYTSAHIHTVLQAPSLHFQSISATYLSHHSNRLL